MDIEKVKKQIKCYYVYVCYVDNEPKYIGMGKGRRLDHCTSGKSSCPELNKDFFEGKSLRVEKVKEKLTNSQARIEESFLIQDYDKQGYSLYNRRRDIDFTQNPNVTRVKDAKILASYDDKSTKHKVEDAFSKICCDTEEDSLYKLNRILQELGVSIYLVKYGDSAPCLVLDKEVVSNYEIKHLACPNWPNCSEYGCGRNLY